VLQLLKLPDGTVKVLVEGGQRARIVKFSDNPTFFEAHAETLAERVGEAKEIEALGAHRRFSVRAVHSSSTRRSAGGAGFDQPDRGSSKLADTVASHLQLKIAESRSWLETDGSRRAA